MNFSFYLPFHSTKFGPLKWKLYELNLLYRIGPRWYKSDPIKVFVNRMQKDILELIGTRLYYNNRVIE